MSAEEALHGLGCPRCGGMVPVPEGQAIVVCPFCDLRSVVRGENGVRRYQVKNRLNRQQSVDAMHKFLSGKMQIARDAASQAVVAEVMLVHLPFWAAWGRGLGWVFGREEVGSDKNRHKEPREARMAEELTWNNAACDVGEFGVTNISLEGRPLEPFNEDQLHRTGMVFEPVGSAQEAFTQAESEFEQRVRSKTSLDEISQAFVRIVHPRLGLVYYPLWVVRYLYKGRSFQVAVDGFSGEVLYGKGPGSVFYRSVVLVAGMAAGAFLGIDAPALLLNSDKNGKVGISLPFILFLVGMFMMFGSYRIFRYGEHYEYRRYRSKLAGGNLTAIPISSLRTAGNILQQLEKLQ